MPYIARVRGMVTACDRPRPRPLFLWRRPTIFPALGGEGAACPLPPQTPPTPPSTGLQTNPAIVLSLCSFIASVHFFHAPATRIRL